MRNKCRRAELKPGVSCFVSQVTSAGGTSRSAPTPWSSGSWLLHHFATAPHCGESNTFHHFCFCVLLWIRSSCNGGPGVRSAQTLSSYVQRCFPLSSSLHERVPYHCSPFPWPRNVQHHVGFFCHRRVRVMHCESIVLFFVPTKLSHSLS